LYECVAVTRKDGPPRAKALVDWLVSEEGQAVIRETGYCGTESSGKFNVHGIRSLRCEALLTGNACKKPLSPYNLGHRSRLANSADAVMIYGMFFGKEQDKNNDLT